MIDNVKKLLSYNWKDVMPKLKATDNEIEVPTEAGASIKNGFYLSFAYAAISSVLSILTGLAALALARNVVNYIGITTRTSFIGLLISAIIGFAISVVILYFVMTFLTSAGPRKPIRYIVILVLVAIGAVSSFFLLLTAFSSIIALLVSLVGVVVSLLAYANIAVGCIDFCLEANKDL